MGGREGKGKSGKGGRQREGTGGMELGRGKERKGRGGKVEISKGLLRHFLPPIMPFFFILLFRLFYIFSSY